MPHVITANRLGDGAVLFMAGSGAWSERLDRAAVYADKPAVAEALALAQKAEAANEVLDIYAIDVSVNGGYIAPLKLREAIRARGPTIHPELAKPGSTPPAPQEDDHVSV